MSQELEQEYKSVSDGDVIRLLDKEGNKYRLKIVSDDCPESPRDWDNVGTMVCWHRNYSLGDVEKSKKYDKPCDFMKDILSEHFDKNKLIEMVKQNKYNNLKLIHQNNEAANKGWNLNTHSDYTHSWYESDYTYNLTDEKEVNDLFDEILSELEDGDLSELVNQIDNIFMLPLYLYDHSGLTMSTGSFCDPWDSGQVGWIYVSKKKVFDECSHTVSDGVWEPVTEDNWKCTAKDYLKNEVKVYDEYLRGLVFGYILEKESICPTCGHIEYENVQSCYGFYGWDTVESGIFDDIGDEYTVDKNYDKNVA